MSLLVQILSSAQECAVQQLTDKEPEVSKEVSTFRQRVSTYLDSVYVKFEQHRDNKNILHQSKKLTDDLQHLTEIAEDLVKKDIAVSALSVAEAKLKLEKASETLRITSELINLHEKYTKASFLVSEKQYFEAMKLLVGAHEHLTGIPKEERVKAINKLIVMVDEAKVDCLTEISRMFEENFVIDGTTLKVSKESRDVVPQLLSTFELHSASVEPLNKITNFLWNRVFVPIVDDGATVKVTENEKFYELNVTAETHSAEYTTLFKNIKQVTTFLYNNLNYPLEECKSTLNYIGRDLRDNLSELLIKHCLEKTIPPTSEGLKNFDTVIQNTKDLHAELVRSEIFTANFTAVTDYVENIDTLFINKKCEEYTTTALKLMKQDLHNMTEVGEPHDPSNPFSESKGTFPKCAVSKSCIAILELADKLLQQSISSTNERIVYTVQNIFIMYQSVVAEHHKKFLETIPQQVALFHNNCFYIAYKLVKWNETYKSKLPTAAVASSSVLFPEQPAMLRAAGAEVFSNYIKQQVAQIEIIMKESGLDNLQTAEEMPPTVEKAVRQCLRQQELLKTVWQKVLSYNMYNKSLGTIMNSLCLYLVNAILKLEDISMVVSEQLVEVYKVVVSRGPKLFTNPKEICLYVNSWSKLNELLYVLSASLVDIDDRWADGKGPLALQFKPEEMRRLIRALFKNTDRRAHVLSKIVD